MNNIDNQQIKSLVEKGADINAKNKKGETALILAQGEYAVGGSAELLKKSGAK